MHLTKPVIICLAQKREDPAAEETYRTRSSRHQDSRHHGTTFPPISSRSSQRTHRLPHPEARGPRSERIIEASCPEDGVVLDCFAGCAYVAIAAETTRTQLGHLRHQPQGLDRLQAPVRQTNPCPPNLQRDHASDPASADGQRSNRPRTGRATHPSNPRPRQRCARLQRSGKAQSLQNSCQHHPRDRDAGDTPRTIPLPGVVLRIRQPQAQWGGHQDH